MVSEKSFLTCCILCQCVLYYYESGCIKDLQKKDLIKAWKFFNVFCFIDDLNAINDAEIFTSNFRDIYPEELGLRR